MARRLYRAASFGLEAAAPLFLRWRAHRGKEDPARIAERLGHASLARPTGPLVWLHGASVGEGLALLPLIARLGTSGAAILLTTGTVTSARLLSTRLPLEAAHQFVPLDTPASVRRFVDHWRPDLAIFAESELWPNLLRETRRRKIATVLANGRMSARSFARWQRMPGFAKELLDGFDPILAQSPADAARFAALIGRPVASVGNLKFDAAAPPADPDALDLLRRGVGTRPVWVAASTHAGEDEICCAVHRTLQAALPDLLTIVVPRRTARGGALHAHAHASGLPAGLRSRGDEITRDTAFYVADTMGELGLFYRLGTAVFVGKSLGEGWGGQNPIEPAKLGNAILHGPQTSNFADTYQDFDDAGAAVLVRDGTELADAVYRLLTSPAEIGAMTARAHGAVDRLAGATDRTMAALAIHLHWLRSGS